MHPIKKIITQLYNMEDTICLTSSPRSGSTWLAERLVEIGKLDWIDEPLRISGGKTDPLYIQGLRARSYLTDSDEHRSDTVRKIIATALAGRLGYLKLNPSIRRRLLLKFVRFNRLLPWAAREFNLNQNILLVRHPCAVVASQLRMHNKKSVWANVKYPAPDIPNYLKDKVNSLSNGEIHRTLAINWAVDQRIPIYDDRPESALLVFYEDLILNEVNELKRICDFSRLTFKQKRDKASATAAPDFAKNKQIEKWKDQLSLEVIDDIIQTVHDLGVDIYSSSSEPSCRPEM